MTASALSSRSKPTTATTRVDRLALIRARAAEREAAKAERQEVKARLDAATAAEDRTVLAQCSIVIDRIARRATIARQVAKLETRADRRRASLLRKNPHTERDAARQTYSRIVTDPTTVGKLIEVKVCRQQDVLTMEHAGGRIDNVEFAIGRLLQDAWTGARSEGDGRLTAMLNGLLTGGTGGDGVLTAREIDMLRSISQARDVAAMNEKLASVIGWVGVKFLRAILIEGHTLKTYAERTVGGGERGVGRVGDRFRWMLSSVAENMHTATGPDRGRIRASREPA